MIRACVLIIDDDAGAVSSLSTQLMEAGVDVVSVNDAFAAIEKLRAQSYCAVVLDPTIRRGLNGYTVLDFVETEQPETIDRLFLFTGMSEQTIRRTAPTVLDRLYRKPLGHGGVAAAILAQCVKRHSVAENRSEKRSLLVEDDRVTAVFMTALLNELGFSVEWVENGEDAIHALSDHDFELVVLDLVLPGIDGFSVLDHIRAECEGLLGRIVVTTGMPDKYLKSLPATGLAGILQKPIHVEALKQLLHGERA